MPSPTRPRIASTAELAKYLDLSEWTVSRAINGHPEVKTSTRERILQAMEETGFSPNPVARSLKGKKMGVVGVSFDHALAPIIAKKIALLDESLRQNGFQAIMTICNQDFAKQVQVLSRFQHLHVDGVILVETGLPPEKIAHTLRGIPHAHIDAANPAMFPGVILDRTRAVGLIFNHLLSLGHTSFGLLGIPSTIHLTRWQGIREAFHDHGLDLKTLQSFESEGSNESYAAGILLAQKVLAARRIPTALLALNDRIARGAIQHFQAVGVKVPEDISIVGFDNLEESEVLTPTLTTVDQQSPLVIKQGVQLLLDQLAKPRSAALRNQKLFVAPELIVRESTGPARKGSLRLI